MLLQDRALAFSRTEGRASGRMAIGASEFSRPLDEIRTTVLHAAASPSVFTCMAVCTGSSHQALALLPVAAVRVPIQNQALQIDQEVLGRLWFHFQGMTK